MDEPMDEELPRVAVYMRVDGGDEYAIGTVTDGTASLAALLRAAATEAEKRDAD